MFVARGGCRTSFRESGQFGFVDMLMPQTCCSRMVRASDVLKMHRFEKTFHLCRSFDHIVLMATLPSRIELVLSSTLFKVHSLLKPSSANKRNMIFFYVVYNAYVI